MGAFTAGSMLPHYTVVAMASDYTAAFQGSMAGFTVLAILPVLPVLPVLPALPVLSTSG